MASPIFNYKTVIIVGIILFAISFAVAVAFPPIYAEHQDIWSILYSIIDNQEKIIDKLDWNNCVILHKEAKQYQPPIKYGWNTQTWEELTDVCGELP